MANKSYEELLFTAVKNGQTAKSVYDIWLELGNTGTPQEFLDSLKGNSATIVRGVTISPTDWVISGSIYKATIYDENVDANSVVNSNFDDATINAAINSGVLGYTNSIDGGFEIYSNFQPSSNLVIDYAVIN